MRCMQSAIDADIFQHWDCNFDDRLHAVKYINKYINLYWFGREKLLFFISILISVLFDT